MNWDKKTALALALNKVHKSNHTLCLIAQLKGIIHLTNSGPC